MDAVASAAGAGVPGHFPLCDRRRRGKRKSIRMQTGGMRVTKRNQMPFRPGQDRKGFCLGDPEENGSGGG